MRITKIHFILLILIPLIQNKNYTYEDTCESRPHFERGEALYFIPRIKGVFINPGDYSTFKTRCFAKNYAELVEITDTTITVKIKNEGKVDDFFCTDMYLVHTTRLNSLQFIAGTGEHYVTLHGLTYMDKLEIKYNGIKVYNFCNSIWVTLKSVYNTFMCFYGGFGYNPKEPNPLLNPKIMKHQQKANLRIMDLYAHYTPERRKNNGKITQIDKKNIHSGDVILILRLDGIDQLITIGAGSRVSHCVIAAWVNDELYVVETQMAWYWPVKGIGMQKWDTWMEWARNADYNVVLLPLRKEFREKFNVQKALDWYYDGVEGLPYGIKNFLFSWIDTPDKNMPFHVDKYLPDFVFTLHEKIHKPSSEIIFTEAMNMRLNKTGLNLTEIAYEAALRNKTFLDIVAMVEKEGWEYSDGRQFTCSPFVTAMLKHAGVFGDEIGNTILPNEFTPGDLYQIDIYEKDIKLVKSYCDDGHDDIPYCMLMGDFKLDLKGYSTVTPYKHMNEKCPTIGPEFIRQEGC